MKKLSPLEIKNTVEKIRKKYNEYSYKYFKSSKYKRMFEERYLNALKQGVDISMFLLAEISAIEEILKREEEKLAKKFIKTTEKKQKSVEKSLIDKVLEDNLKKIAEYPDIIFHKDAIEEVRRLLGALNKLEQEYWPQLYAVLKNTIYSMNSHVMMKLETHLIALARINDENISPRLERYKNRLNIFPRDYQVLEKESKDYILECSFFLHDFYEVLDYIWKRYDTMDHNNREKLKKIKEYVNGIILNFRLVDLKKKK